jgi:hypothetical protein
MIHTDEEDNLIIRTHIYDANKHLPIHEKVAMNVFVTGIEVDGEEVTFHHIVTEPILDDECGVTKDALGDAKFNKLENLGQRDLIKIQNFEEPIKSSLRAAVREIQIRKIGI